MFKKSLAVILSCIMMTIPVVSFAETTEAVETVEILKIAETQEATEIAETERDTSETNQTAKTIEIAETQENICESKFPFEYMYPEKLQSKPINGDESKNEIISDGSGSGVGVVADN